MIAEIILTVLLLAVPVPVEAADTSAAEPDPVATESTYTWDGPTWDTYKGLNMGGPSGPETGYNLPMDGVIYLMRQMGYTEEDYPYWIREDGIKMFGPYVMVGAYLPLRPKGTILPTSRGMGIVVDTGYFAYGPTQLDLAYAW